MVLVNVVAPHCPVVSLCQATVAWPAGSMPTSTASAEPSVEGGHSHPAVPVAAALTGSGVTWRASRVWLAWALLDTAAIPRRAASAG